MKLRMRRVRGSVVGRTTVTALVLLATVLVMSACGDASEPAETTATTTAGGPVTPKSINIQLSDLPPGMHECTYSGDMDTYVRNVQQLNADTYRDVSATWEKFKSEGAVGGYAAYYGSNDLGCENLFKPTDQREFGDEQEHIMNHPKMVFAYVIEYRDVAAAEQAYLGDSFGQSALKQMPAFHVSDGVVTGLGANSVVSESRGSPIERRNAIWQNKAYSIFFSSTAIPLSASTTATTAMNSRIP